MIAEFDEIQTFAEDCFNSASVAAETIQFSLNESRRQYSKSADMLNAGPAMIGNEPQFALLENSYGMGAWSVILSVDLRQSSKRAVKIGAAHTYLTMHTYLPTMAELVGRADGKIVGLRGDGLFAAFGLTELKGTGCEVTSEVAGRAVQNATRCGKAMLEATDDILSPLLVRHEIEGNLRIGVGIADGNIVITRIGWRDATEVTAYGPPVNQACKLCGATEIRMTPSAERLYPTGKGGRVTFRQIDGACVPEFPSDMLMLGRNSKRVRTVKPR